VIAFYPDGTEKIFKLLSSDPKNYSDAANEAIRRILEEFEGRPLAKGTPLELTNIGESSMSY
jgi:5-oxoprolinase (ATP-hydrolysing)